MTSTRRVRARCAASWPVASWQPLASCWRSPSWSSCSSTPPRADPNRRSPEPIRLPNSWRRSALAYHLDDPLVAQYWAFLKSALQFDFGNSYTLREPITTLVWRAAVQITVPLLVMTWVVATSVGVALGYLAARSRGGVVDRIIVSMTTLGACAPVFATSILIAYVFGVRLGWFPYLGTGQGVGERMHHLVLPAATMTLVLLAGTTRLTRVRIAQTLDEDQVTFARARGLSSAYVTTRVVLRNSAVHMVTFSGSLVIALIGGTVIVEQIYGLPGVGSNLIQAINSRDIPMVQGLTLFIAVVVVIVNLAVDLACLALDPRLRSGLADDS